MFAIFSYSRSADQMCRQDSRVHLSAEEEIAAEESLSIYCKPVELYNILQRRASRNVTYFSYIIILFVCCFLFNMIVRYIQSVKYFTSTIGEGLLDKGLNGMLLPNIHDFVFVKYTTLNTIGVYG